MGMKLLREVEEVRIDPEKVAKIKEENDGKLILTCQLQKANTVNANGRYYPKRLLEREMEKYHKIIKSRNAMGELDHPDCYSPDAMILTKDSWKYLKDIDEKEEIYSININTKELELQTIDEKVVQKYKGTMYNFSSRSFKAMVTPNHRFLVQNRKGELIFKTAEEIYTTLNGDNISEKSQIAHSGILKKGLTWNGIEYNNITIPGIELVGTGYSSIQKEKYAKDLIIDAETFYSFLGIWLAEGGVSLNKRQLGSTLTITQKLGEKSQKIENLINSLPDEILKYKRIQHFGKKVIFSITDVRLASFFIQFGTSLYDKHLVQWVKDADVELLNLLLDWFILGDGDIVGKRRRLYSVSKQLVYDLHECLIKTGSTGNIQTRIDTQDYEYAGHIIKAENKQPLYILTIRQNETISLDPRCLKIEKVENYDDYVYCVKVKNQTFIAMVDGYIHYTGNSANISLQKVSHVITEAEWEGDAIMGKIELLNTPFGKIASSLVEQGVLIGVSSRAVGSTKRNNNGYDEVLEDLQLICWDIISNPSTPGSWIMTESIDIDEQTTSALKSYNKAYEYVKAQRDRMSKYGI